MITASDIDDIVQKPFIGLSRKDVNRYSLQRVFRSLINNKKLSDGLEGECDQEMRRNMTGGVQHITGFGIPWDIFPRHTRGAGDMQVGVFGQGGALVQTDIPDSIVPVLRNKMVCGRLGATMLGGLEGMLSLPVATSASQPQTLGETAPANQSGPTFSQINLSPRRMTTHVDWSRQLALQSSPDIENYLRNDCITQNGVQFDQYALIGTGANNQPTGILNTAGVGTVNFGGAPTWAKILEFEADLSTANADQPGTKFGWATTPGVRKAWKNTARALAGATTVSAVPLWEPGNFNDGSSDGVVNSYRAAITNNISLDRVLFGAFDELILATWGQGMDLLYDPYSRSKEGIVGLTLTTFGDVALKHAQSFAVSIDAGDQ